MHLLGLLIIATSTAHAQDVINSLPKYTVTLGLGDANGCGPKSECDVYLPFGDLVKNETFHAFFRTTLGRTIYRYVVECCGYNHTFVGRPLNRSPTVFPTERECGFPALSAAFDAQKHGAWPWLAALGQGNSSSFVFCCVGALITSRHFLTVAHVFRSNSYSYHPTLVVLGDDNPKRDEDNAHVQYVNIQDFVSAVYDHSTKREDIAIIILERDVTFSDYVRPACLPFSKRDDTFIGDMVTVVGYGHPINNDPTGSTAAGSPTFLPKARAATLSVAAKVCQETFRSPNIDSNDYLCVLGNGTEPCTANSGSPLHFYDVTTRRYYVVGLFSRGPSCFRNDSTNVSELYTRVGAFIGWIVHTITTIQP